MKSFSILLFTFVLLLLAPHLTSAVFPPEAIEIPYQINNSDRIVIGTVSDIEVHDSFKNNTITVDEWLYNPLPEKIIIVRTTSWAEEAKFTQNESVLLMLNDQRPDKGVFYMSFGEVGKRPVSDRDAVIKELKAQGKWKVEDQIGNTIIAGMIENTTIKQKENITENKTGIVDTGIKQENSTQKSKNTPFISPIWLLLTVFGAVRYMKKLS